MTLDNDDHIDCLSLAGFSLCIWVPNMETSFSQIIRLAWGSIGAGVRSHQHCVMFWQKGRCLSFNKCCMHVPPLHALWAGKSRNWQGSGSCATPTRGLAVTREMDRGLPQALIQLSAMLLQAAGAVLTSMLDV